MTDEGADFLCIDPDPCSTGSCGGAAGCVYFAADTDGDGFYPEACGGTDCLDVNPSVWAVPVEVTNLQMTKSDPMTLAWDDQSSVVGSSVFYEVVTGGGNAQGPGPDFATSRCLDIAPTASSIDARLDPLPGAFYWYLVRGRDACGYGGLGSGQRDDAVPTWLCPY